MVKLIARTPCAGLLPLDIGTLHLQEVVIAQAQSIAPFKGQQKAVAAMMPVAFPKPNRVSGTDPRAVWTGPGQALLIGAALDKAPAALVDQSDSLAAVMITGAEVEQVLARLVPLDLRAMKAGHTARTLIGHMNGSVTRLGPDSFEVMVMRSMAATLVHDLERAARLFFAR